MTKDRMVTCSLRDTTGCRFRSRERLVDIPKILRLFEREAAELMKKTGADHVLYACKIYDADDNLVAVQFYNEPMDDETFDRVTRQVRGVLIYALHNHNRR